MRANAIWFILGLWIASCVSACGLLSAAVQNPNLQAFVFNQITEAMSDTLEDRLENVPFTLDYDHAETMVRTDGTVRDGEHVWMVTVKDKDLEGVFDNGAP